MMGDPFEVYSIASASIHHFCYFIDIHSLPPMHNAMRNLVNLMMSMQPMHNVMGNLVEMPGGNASAAYRLSLWQLSVVKLL